MRRVDLLRTRGATVLAIARGADRVGRYVVAEGADVRARGGVLSAAGSLDELGEDVEAVLVVLVPAAGVSPEVAERRATALGTFVAVALSADSEED